MYIAKNSKPCMDFSMREGNIQSWDKFQQNKRGVGKVRDVSREKGEGGHFFVTSMF